MKNHKYEPLLYTAVALLYSVRVSLLGGFPFATRGVFALFFVMSLYYLIKANQLPNRGTVLRWLNIVFGVVVVYGFFYIVSGVDSTWVNPSSPFSYFYDYSESILPIYAFYYFGNKGWISDNWFRRVTVLFVLFAAYTFYSRQLMIVNIYDYDVNVDSFTNNAGYTLLALFPLFAFFRKKPVLLYGFIVANLLAIMYGQKRGAILMGALCVMYVYWVLNREARTFGKMFVLIAFVTITVVASQYIENLMENSSSFDARMMELANGEASGRELMYPLYFSFYINSSIFHLIFGHGAEGTCHYLGLMAHNDWLEFLINMGWVGFFPLLGYWISIFRNWEWCRSRCEPEIVLAFGMFAIIYFGKSLISMSIMGMSVVATAVFGYCLAMLDNSRIKH